MFALTCSFYKMGKGAVGYVLASYVTDAKNLFQKSFRSPYWCFKFGINPINVCLFCENANASHGCVCWILQCSTELRKNANVTCFSFARLHFCSNLLKICDAVESFRIDQITKFLAKWIPWIGLLTMLTYDVFVMPE